MPKGELQVLINNAKQKLLPFVIYKKPTEEVFTYLQQNNNILYTCNELKDSGFVIAHFDSAKDTYLIKNDDTKTFVTTSFLTSQQDKFVQDIEDVKAKEFHVQLVKKAIKHIQAQHCEKIVIARKEAVQVNNFDEVTLFCDLMTYYPTTFVYLWYHPKLGMWVGASPETLIKVDERLNFQTMSLAGTTTLDNYGQVIWGAKELDEQKIVTDFILDQIGTHVNDLTFSGVETVNVGKLYHLKTQISGFLKSNDKLKILVDTLHPTPAVCGLPKQEAQQFIVKEEGFDRSFYTGYLGELNLHQQTNLYVNLRCAEIENPNKVNLYIGGGITAASNAVAEWQETKNKSLTIKKLLDF